MATVHKGHIFRFQWVAFIYRFDCIIRCCITVSVCRQG